MKIVVVEDDPNLNEIMARVLTSEGHEVFSTLDGLDAFELINKVDPDVIFLDILLPNIDGRDICRDIRSNPKTINTQIVVISGRNSDLDKKLYFELGANDFVSKPISKYDIIRLSQRVERNLEKNNNN